MTEWIDRRKSFLLGILIGSIGLWFTSHSSGGHEINQKQLELKLPLLSQTY